MSFATDALRSIWWQTDAPKTVTQYFSRELNVPLTLDAISDMAEERGGQYIRFKMPREYTSVYDRVLEYIQNELPFWTVKLYCK